MYSASGESDGSVACGGVGVGEAECYGFVSDG